MPQHTQRASVASPIIITYATCIRNGSVASPIIIIGEATFARCVCCGICETAYATSTPDKAPPKQITPQNDLYCHIRKFLSPFDTKVNPNTLSPGATVRAAYTHCLLALSPNNTRPRGLEACTCYLYHVIVIVRVSSSPLLHSCGSAGDHLQCHWNSVGGRHGPHHL